MKPGGDDSYWRFVSTLSNMSILVNYKGIILAYNKLFFHRAKINLEMRPGNHIINIKVRQQTWRNF